MINDDDGEVIDVQQLSNMGNVFRREMYVNYTSKARMGYNHKVQAAARL